MNFSVRHEPACLLAGQHTRRCRGCGSNRGNRRCRRDGRRGGYRGRGRGQSFQRPHAGNGFIDHAKGALILIVIEHTNSPGTRSPDFNSFIAPELLNIAGGHTRIEDFYTIHAYADKRALLSNNANVDRIDQPEQIGLRGARGFFL